MIAILLIFKPQKIAEMKTFILYTIKNYSGKELQKAHPAFLSKLTNRIKITTEIEPRHYETFIK